MKSINIIGYLAFLSFFTFSCIDDKGNYNYEEDPSGLTTLSITGLTDTTVIRTKILNLEPVIQNMADENRYSYVWYAYGRGVSGFIPKRDTLGLTKNLSADIKLAGGQYYLYFQIKDKERDLYTYKRINLDIVESDITIGWYVLKDIDNETDFDYINLKDEIVPDVLRNISDGGVGNQLKGKAIKIVFQPSKYDIQIEKDDGTLEKFENQSALHIISTTDFKTFNAENVSLYQKIENQFYGPPSNYAPRDIQMGYYGMGDIYLNNDGKLHTIYGMSSSNIGKFSGAVVAKTSKYDLFHALHANIFGNCLVFDNLSRSFWMGRAGASDFFELPEETTRPSPKGMNAKLLYFQQSVDGDPFPIGYAVMQSISNNEEYYLASCNMQADYLFSSFDTIPTGAMMPKAEVKHVPTQGNYLYYAYANKMYAYKSAKALVNRESLIKELPASEEITFIKTFTNPYSNVASVAILVNYTGGWKMYLFDLLGIGNPEIKPEPVKIFSGTGYARHVIYRF